MNTTKILATITAIVALSAPAWADTSVKLNGVHLCCNSCVKGVEKAVSKVNGVTAVIDKDGGTVALSAADKATVEKGVAALVAGGYFGKSEDASLQPKAHTGAKAGKAQKLTVYGVHLCCGKCVKAVNDAVGKVHGVKGTTAEKNAASFEVTGDFQANDVFAALEKAGLSGRAMK